MKTEVKHEFKSIGVITVLMLVGFSVLVIAAPWRNWEGNSQKQAALEKAEIIAYQAAQVRRNLSTLTQTNVNGGRTPASTSSNEESEKNVGSMGLDPWGHPFHYRFFQTNNNKVDRVLVWSDGPNKIHDSQPFDSPSYSIESRPVFEGDDLGVFINVSQE